MKSPKAAIKKEVAEKSVAEEIIEGLASFREALEKGEVNQRLTVRKFELNLKPTTSTVRDGHFSWRAGGVSPLFFGLNRGLTPPARLISHSRTTYNPKLVIKTRELFGVSQALFARFLGISVKTVRAWEQGINTPNNMACRFMDEIRYDPQYWTERLKKSIVAQTF